MKNCPCCSGKSYQNCCEPYHQNLAVPSTAEALMRSRFSAFAIPNAEYLYQTTLPRNRKHHDKAELQEWAKINTWTKLEITKTPSLNEVEFKAYYTDTMGDAQIHHESSTFQKIRNRWYYVSGVFL